ncbi:carbohydrate ABC transporter permease [Paenibacillus sp. GCM10023248]|uniref:carbohydrate ABC transporter permease n=1 Tax=Bacillales TaxID=1385 RepID=UPI0023781F9B|nr:MULTISPECIES: sugar ABC transporter permease [Bacillales]MDD9266855.1 sugar ABC transporter permease [Paenibacillus sp. MAHUQ-63]MDR6881054.1 arabinosaccharide transport system permease protein [Bacillus sp. 3255]
MNKFLYSSRLAPYVFVLPFVLSFLIFFAYPVITTIVMSFQEVLPGQTHFIGLKNYQNLWSESFFTALWNSSRYTFWTLLVLIPLPLVLAVFLNAKLTKASAFFRSALFIPSLTSVVVAGTIFRLVFGSLDESVMNGFRHLLGLPSINWLANSATGMFVLIVLATWRFTGVNIIYFLSALQSIPHELYESAEIDGANKWDRFWRITLPLLKPVAIYVITISIYGGYSMFTESFILWNGNRSPNDIGLTMIGLLYREGIERNNLGFGSAIGITLLGLTMVLNVIQLKFFGLFRKED